MFNHERLFLPLPANKNSNIPDMSDLLPELRRKLKEGKYAEATEYYLENLYSRGFPSELIWTDPFHPAFDLIIRMEKDGDVFGYRRWTDFETGETGVEWKDGRGAFSRKLFVSRKCNAVVLSLKAPSREKLDCRLMLTEHPGGKHIKYTEIRVIDPGKANDTRGYKDGCGGISGVPGAVGIPCTAGALDIAEASGEADASGASGTSYLSCAPQSSRSVDPSGTVGASDTWMLFRAIYEVGNGGYEGIIRIHAEGGRVSKLDGNTFPQPGSQTRGNYKRAP